MDESEVSQRIILPALEAARSRIPYFARESPQPDTPLFGVDRAVLDSMSLVTFVLLLEECTEKATGKGLGISAGDILDPTANPFASLRALSAFVTRRVQAGRAT